MEQFTVEFQNLSQLQEIWNKNFSSGTSFIPTAKLPAVHAELGLLLKVREGGFGLLVPCRVIQILQGQGPKGTGMVLEFLGFTRYQKQIKNLLIDPAQASGLKDFTAYAKIKGLDAPEIKAVVHKSRSILNEMQNRKYYKVLGVDLAASRKEIRDAYFRLTKELHPDNYPQGEFTDEVMHLLESAYQKVSQAYEVLRDEKKKNEYDVSTGVAVRSRGESDDEYKTKKTLLAKKRYREENSENVRKAEGLFREAQKSIRDGEVKAAIATLRIALSFDPMNADCRQKLQELEKQKGTR